MGYDVDDGVLRRQPETATGCAMTEYQIQPNTRRCSATGRELQPGERFYTALFEEGDHFLRRDYSSEAWQGTPGGAFSFWTGKVPRSDEVFKPRFDDDLLEECFQRLEGQTEPSKVSFRYVVALLLIRRKRLKFEQTVKEGTDEIVCVSCPGTGAKHRLVNPRLSDDEMTRVQEEVFSVLGWS
jgi:hypothetical protein